MILAGQIAAGILVAWLLIRHFRFFAALGALILTLAIVVGGIVIVAERIGDNMDRISAER